MTGATQDVLCKLCSERHRLGGCPKFMKNPRGSLAKAAAAPAKVKPGKKSGRGR